MIMVAMVTVTLGYQVSTHFKVQLQAVALVNKALKPKITA